MPRKVEGLASREIVVVEPFKPWPYGVFTSPHTYTEKPKLKPKRKKSKCSSSSSRTSFASLLASR